MEYVSEAHPAVPRAGVCHKIVSLLKGKGSKFFKSFQYILEIRALLSYNRNRLKKLGKLKEKKGKAKKVRSLSNTEKLSTSIEQ